MKPCVDGLSRRQDGSLDHRRVRWWQMRPILDAQTRLQMSQVNLQSGGIALNTLVLKWQYTAALKVRHLLLRWGSPGWPVCREVLELVGRQIAGSHVCTSSADRHGSGYRVRARNKKWFSGDGCLPSVWCGQPNDIELSSTWPRFPSSCRFVALQYLEPCPSIGYVQYGVDSA